MVAAAARQIRDGEIVFAGMRLPLLGFAVAKATHAPRAIGLFENGLIRELPPRGFVVTMGDGPNQRDATCATTLIDVLGMLQRGRVDVGFLGGAEVDAFGNLNTTRVGKTRLPGSGGGSDIAALSRRCVYVMEHERRRFVERVGYVTSRPRGVVTLITTLGVFTLADGPPRVVSLHHGVTRAQVERETGFALDFAQAEETPAPSEAELRAIAEADPSGFWTR
ncbi:MAG: CoA-transferase [Candidatus Eremiobacteraeota bacterium]|nr:CoA-transferase [Candidatus Eremiobacteraeota bacterium]